MKFAVPITVFFVLFAPALSLAAEPEEFTRVRNVVYAQPAGKPLLAELYLPKGDGPHPGVLVVHGGAWHSGDRHQLAVMAKKFAEAGMAAVAIQYRLAPEHKHPAQIEDCQAAVRWMRDNAKTHRIDADRIGGYGYSAGGHLVSLLATLDEPKAVAGQPAVTSARIAAAVAGGAPLNFEILPQKSRMLAYWLGGTRGEKAAAYRHASPTTHITPDDPPMLFFHGERDALVPPVSPQAMVLLLAANKVEAKVEMVRKAGHIEAMFDKKTQEACVTFLKEKLGKKNVMPSAAGDVIGN